MTGWDEPSTTWHGADDGRAASGPPSSPSREHELGHGGGGVVATGLDRHLPREVAWKSAPADSPHLRRRLEREARALARLEHPGIVPIYDLVATPTELRLALRVIHGETLADRIVRAPDVSSRIGLVRPVLAVAQALAWAHHCGWVHRDVKPSNIMIGAFGEVQLIDWGLALELAAPPDRELDPVGAVVGTPATMSPEQARGEDVGPAADVWGLGATVFEVIAGHPLHAGLTVEAMVGRLAQGLRPRLADVCPSAPPELAAIVERALAPCPADRYASAGEFADDLSAYLDGRLVAAHAYGATERLARFVRRWRLPLGLAAAVVVGAVIAGIVSYARVEAERDRVVAAHGRATEALRARDAELVRASAAESRAALADDERPEAELAAAAALAVAEDPTARGVLAAFARAPRPEHAATLATGPCLDADVSPDGRTAVCGRKDALVLWRDGAPRWTRREPHRAVVLSDGGRHVLEQRLDGTALVLDVADGHPVRELRETLLNGKLRAGPGAAFAIEGDDQKVALIDAAGERLWRPCGNGAYQAVSVDEGGARAALCLDGRLRVETAAGEAREVATPLASTLREYVTLALAGPRAALVGTTRGALFRVDLASGEVVARATPSVPRMIHRIEVDCARGLAAVEFEGAGAGLVDAESLVSLGVLPRDARPLRFLADGRFATQDDALAFWRLPLGEAYAVRALGSISALAFDDGGVLAVARDQGAAMLDLGHRAVSWRADFGSGVTKAVVPRGERLAVAIAGERGAEREVTELYGGRVVTSIFSSRRLVEARLPGGAALAASTTMPGLDLRSSPRDALSLDGAHVYDLASHGSWLVALENRPRRFVAWDLARAPLPVARCELPVAQAVAVAPGGPDGVEVLTLEPSAVSGWSLDCQHVALYAAPRGELWKVVASPDGAWVAAGTLGGELFVWRRDGGLVAAMPLHAEAVTALAVDPTSTRLATGAWDGTVRIVDLATLDVPRGELAAAVVAAWRGR